MAEQTQNPPPSHDELEDLMLSCRYGDLEDVQAFVDRFGWTPLDEVRDESGNTILHMICGNGHLELLNLVLPHISPSLLGVANTSGQSTPLHWAAINAHLSIAQALVSHPGGPGSLLIDAHNAAGQSPLGEAELAGADDVAKWFVEVMMIDQSGEMMEAGAGEDELPPDGPKTSSVGSEKMSESVEKLSLDSNSTRNG